MTTQRVWPGLGMNGTSFVVYAEDGVTLIPAAGGADVTLVQEVENGPEVLPAYYRNLQFAGRLLTYDPLGLSGDAISVPAVTRVSGSVVGLLVASLSSTSIISDGAVVQVVGTDAVGDSGSGLQYRGVVGDTSTVDDVLVRSAPNGRWHLVWDGTRLRSGAAGVKGDCRRITDGVRVAGEFTLTSATAEFTSADVGKIVLLCEPSQPCAGTVTTTSASQAVTGSGTSFLSQIERETAYAPTRPSSGGCIFIGSTLYIILSVNNDTSITLKQPASSSAPAQTLYREVHTEAVIQSVTDANTAVLSVAATVSMSGVTVDFGTNDDDAIDLFDLVCHENRVAEQFYQEGTIAIYNSHNFGADVTDPEWQSKRRQDRRVMGAGMNRTIFSRLRKISYQTEHNGEFLGALTWILCVRVEVSDIAFTDNLPLLGIYRSTGGILNGSGGRVGIAMRHPHQSGFRRIGASGYGARDEHCFQDSSYAVQNDYICGCAWDVVNCNGVNPNSGNFYNHVVTDNNVGSFFSATQIAINTGLVGNNIFRGQTALPNEGAVMVVEAFGRIQLVNNVVENVNYGSAYSTSPVQIFGSASPDAQLNIVGLRVRNVAGTWHIAANGAVIEIVDMDGSLNLSDVMVSDADATVTAARFILVRNSNGRINFAGGIFDDGTNMTVGVEIDSSTGDACVLGEESLVFGPGVTQPLKTPSLTKLRRYRAITAGGTNAVQSYIDVVNVTHNGATTAQLRDPSTMPLGWTVSVCNDTTQMGTTTVSAAAGSIVGSTSLAGAGAFGIYKNFGSYWRNVA